MPDGASTVWTGRPIRSLYLRATDWPLLLLSAVMLGFGILFFGGFFSASPPPGLVFLFGIVWCVGVVVQGAGPILFAAMARSRTTYALTPDGVALIVTEFFGTRVKRVYLPAVDKIELGVNGDGSGTISFGEAPATLWWMNNRTWSPPRPPSFDCIANVVDVYDMCTKLQQVKTA